MSAATRGAPVPGAARSGPQGGAHDGAQDGSGTEGMATVGRHAARAGSRARGARRARGTGRWSRPLAPWRALLVALVVGLLGAAAAGGAASAVLAPRATAQASLVLAPAPGNAYATASRDVLADLETEAELPTSDAVLERVVAAVPGTTVEGLRGRVRASVAPRTQVVQVQVSAPRRAEALALARALADAVLATRAERAGAALGARREVLERQLAAAEGALVAVRSAEAADPVEDAVLSRRVVALRTELRATGAEPSPGALIGTVPLGQSRSRELLAAAGAGGALAGGAALLLALRRPRPARRARRAARDRG
ncbi:hypothetical protein [Vallicoccus soli]|uniref:hypothetical protein n=1 Tax=Vallicoccus soli TaxID=2339232 RepID=UPI0014027866|nr:hypothetical protein [Vallicoccus soli]